MTDYEKLKTLGFSQYEITCYLTLASHHPINGSRLSKISGIARSRVYDVLRNLIRKGFVLEVEEGKYVPLPPVELYKRLKLDFDNGLDYLKQQLNGTSQDAAYEFIWMIRGHDLVMAKAREIISTAARELYVRLFPEAGALLVPDLKAAERRGVGIRYISMGPAPEEFKIQVEHPDSNALLKKIGGRSFDIIADRSEALVGIFEDGMENTSPITWTRNRLFIIANRDSLRHDFYHYFLDKLYEKGKTLTQEEERIHALIKSDD